MAKTARHGDLTARKKAELQAQHRDQQEQQARRMAMIDAQAQENREGVVDLTNPNSAKPDTDGVPEVKDALTADEQAAAEPAQNVGEVTTVPDVQQTVEVEDVERMVTFRVNENMPQVTIGVGKTYDFVEGQKYRAPKRVYDHLEEKGLIYH